MYFHPDLIDQLARERRADLRLAARARTRRRFRRQNR